MSKLSYLAIPQHTLMLLTQDTPMQRREKKENNKKIPRIGMDSMALFYPSCPLFTEGWTSIFQTRR